MPTLAMQPATPLPAMATAAPTVTLHCPHCQAIQVFAMEMAGQVARCGSCNLPFQIPVPQAQQLGGGSITVNVTTPAPTPREPFDFPDEPVIQSSYRRNTGNGVTAMVLGILGLVLCGLLAPIAVMVGHQAMQDDPRDGCAKAGYIMGWIGSAFLLVALLYVCGYWGMMTVVLGSIPRR
jgi:hypothetical protein